MGNFFYRCWLLLAAECLLGSTLLCQAGSEDALPLADSHARAVASVEFATESIDRLVVELGSDKYFVRQRAESELLRIGPDVFDALIAVEGDDDLEVASRARYILSRMQIEWVRPEDSPKVQRLMARYKDISLEERAQCIVRLATLDDDQGLAALCRITRYDRSPLQAKRAALQIILKKNPPSDRGTRGLALLVREMGVSRRTPIQWIETYVDQWRDSKDAVHRWQEWIEAEDKLLAQRSGETSTQFILSLLEHQLYLCDDLLDADPEIRMLALSTLERLVDLQQKQQRHRHLGLFQVLNQVRIQEKWHVLAMLEQRYGSQLKEHRSLLYLVAATRDQQGLEEEAQQISERAFQLSADDDNQRNTMANELLSLGRLDWAEREWRYIIDVFPIADDHSAEARRSLASWCLHDRGEDQAAAQLLTDYFDALDSQQNKKKPHQTSPLRAQRDYYLACYAKTQKDYVLQKKHLESAVKHYDADPDILIAMYHLEDADEKFRLQTRQKIQQVSTYLMSIIERYPNEANFYNHWAWLISNTEGDFQKATEFSHRSLELNPNEASYLDTLGRCYYATGDLENAIKYQQLAVKSNPQLRVMRRQLKQFEKEWKEGN